MPWKETVPMDERIRLVEMVLRERHRTMAGICRAFGVAPKTGFKWLARYKAEGQEGLVERSRAPLHRPFAVSGHVEAVVLEARRVHQTWGPRKLLAWLEPRHPSMSFPAASTVGALLARKGLVRERKRKHRVPPYTQPLKHCEAPNDVWCTDFKGSFCTCDGERCHPLTLSDAFSRFLLRCQGLREERYPRVRPIFEAVFREHGLPTAMRSDNGPPFASSGGLSPLSVWWIKLGIRPERIEPGHPEQNGRHERMHRTLKQETAKPAKRDLRRQQEAFDRFRREYNYERPHESLGQKTPASVYRSSTRPFPQKLPAIEYPRGFEVRAVRDDGCFKWYGAQVHLTRSLIGERVSLEPIDDGLWTVRFSFLELGTLDETTGKLVLRRSQIDRRP